MNRVLLSLAALTVVSFPNLVLVAACSSTPTPHPTGSDPIPYGPTGEAGSIISADAGADANADAPVGTDSGTGVDAADAAPTACNALVADGPVVGETTLAGKTPVEMGGAIASGKYVLTERDYYSLDGDNGDGGSGQGNIVVQRVYVFDATTVNLAERQGPVDAGAITKLTRASSYMVSGKLLAMTESCPYPKVNTNLRFSIVGNQLWLFPGGGVREVYTLQ